MSSDMQTCRPVDSDKLIRGSWTRDVLLYLCQRKQQSSFHSILRLFDFMYHFLLAHSAGRVNATQSSIINHVIFVTHQITISNKYRS